MATRPAITYKLTIETLEHGVKYGRTLTLNIFHT